MLAQTKPHEVLSIDEEDERTTLMAREVRRLAIRDKLLSVLEPVAPALLGSLGFLLFLAIWQMIHGAIAEIPSPGFTFNAAVELFSHPC